MQTTHISFLLPILPYSTNCHHSFKARATLQVCIITAAVEIVMHSGAQDGHDNQEDIKAQAQLMDRPNPLAIPEILSMVGPYLDYPSLAACLCTCRFWHDTLLPYLWIEADLWPDHKSYRPTRAAVQKNSAHIRKLTLVYRNSVDYPEGEQLTCTNLTRLMLEWSKDNIAMNHLDLDSLSLHNFVRRHCQTLQNVSLAFGYNHGPALDQLLDALVFCRRLRRLSIAHDLVIRNPTWWVGVFESLCSHLETFEFWNIDQVENTTEISTALWPDSREPNRIQDLRLSYHQDSGVYPVHVWILRQCTNVTRLHWESNHRHHKQMLQDLCNMIQSRQSCQRLEDLSLPYLGNWDTFPSKEFAGLITCMAPLVRLDLRTSRFYIEDWETLRSMPRHLAALKILHLPPWLEGSAVHDILCAMPQLTDFMAGELRDTDISEDDREWICLGMQKLNVSLIATTQTGGPLILSRLSKLTRLEKIIYDNYRFVATESSLSQLKGLRHMRWIDGTFPKYWNAVDIQWVLDNWPLMKVPSRDDLREQLRMKAEGQRLASVGKD